MGPVLSQESKHEFRETRVLRSGKGTRLMLLATEFASQQHEDIKALIVASFCGMSQQHEGMSSSRGSQLLVT
eukprot:1140685-Pelagomonas_calceolata.AAC.5